MVAICVAIYSAPFWQMLRDRGQLSPQSARDAAAWALEAVIEAGRVRAAARKVKRSDEALSRSRTRKRAQS